MKKLESFNKLIKIMSIALIVLLAAQVVMVFLPFFEDRTPEATAKVPDPVAGDYSMMDYAFFKTEEVSSFLKTDLKLGKKYEVNDFVMGIVFAFALGATALVANICSQKSIFTNIVSVMWAAMAPVAFLFDDVMALGNQGIRWGCVVVSIVGGLIALVRLYPWFCVKFLSVKIKKKERAAAAAAAQA